MTRTLAALARTAVEQGAALPLELVAELAARGCAVTVDRHFLPDQCTWCQLEGAVTVARVHGDPGPLDPHMPLDQAEVCLRCLPAALRQVEVEQDPNSDRDIEIEVAPQ